ncbi:unnamed protein product [Peniophora sp. CBMAI 1063]|nr:unnamed protein product [Peniophora sp. CBMAI 1063]
MLAVSSLPQFITAAGVYAVLRAEMVHDYPDLETDSVETIHLRGLAEDDSIVLQKSPFSRDIPSSTLLTFPGNVDEAIVNGIIPENPKLPPKTGRCELHLELGELLGSGATGVVHAVTSLEGVDVPLCVKIAFPSERAALSSEAWFYDDLQDIQGVVIPKCFGYFEKTLSLSTRLRISDHRSRFPTWDNGADRGTIPGRIGVLLLEKLSGEHLELHTQFRDDNSHAIYCLFLELSHRFVHHNDIRYDNILRVVPSGVPVPHRPTSQEQISSPWRLVDLASCQKHTFDRMRHYLYLHGSRVRHLLKNVQAQEGHISDDM